MMSFFRQEQKERNTFDWNDHYLISESYPVKIEMWIFHSQDALIR